MKTIPIVIMLILVAGATSGCIETRSYTHTEPIEKCAPMYTTSDLSNYTTENEINAGFPGIEITLNPDKSGTVNEKDVSWVKTGTRGNVWSCAIVGSDEIDYVYFFMNRTTIGYTGNNELTGRWWR